MPAARRARSTSARPVEPPPQEPAAPAPAEPARRQSRLPIVVAAYVFAIPVIYFATKPDAVPRAVAGLVGLMYVVAVVVGVARFAGAVTRGSRTL